MSAAGSDAGHDPPGSVPPGAPHRAVIRDDRSAPEGWEDVAAAIDSWLVASLWAPGG